MSRDNTGPRPRQYADQILRMPTLEERRAALQRVPPEWRDLVKKHAEIAWNHPQRNQPHGQQTD
ncbi:hypothetical protein FQZ97_1010470 [compost metagenome]